MDDTNTPPRCPLVSKTPTCTCMHHHKRNTVPEKPPSQCCYIILLQVAISFGVVCISNKIGCSSNDDQANKDETIQSLRFRRHAMPPSTYGSSEGHMAWSSYYLDQQRFYKGKPFLPWISEANETTIPLTNNSCFNITVGGLYNVYSKLTFEFTPTNVTQYTYHAINMKRWSPKLGNMDVSILEKNVISPSNVTLRQFRMFQTSQILFLRTLTPGDVICVVVPDTSLIYHSKIDNTMNIHTLSYNVR